MTYKKENDQLPIKFCKIFVFPFLEEIVDSSCGSSLLKVWNTIFFTNPCFPICIPDYRSAVNCFSPWWENPLLWVRWQYKGYDLLHFQIKDLVLDKWSSLYILMSFQLQVYSWEPTVCHDTVNMRWSTLGDLCIHEGKLLGCSYYENSAAVWAAEISVVAFYYFFSF